MSLHDCRLASTTWNAARPSTNGSTRPPTLPRRTISSPGFACFSASTSFAPAGACVRINPVGIVSADAACEVFDDCDVVVERSSQPINSPNDVTVANTHKLV
jgi:hypothetical protein